MKKIGSMLLAVLLGLVVLAGCAGGPEGAAKPDRKPLSLTILHMNDTHAKLEPALTEFRLDIDEALKAKRTYAELGGFPRIWAAVAEARKANRNVLFLHAGDVFQGTLFFTQFSGKADRDFLNAMGLDAMAVGNHEFDMGPAVLKDFADGAKFPILSANLDLSAEPALASVIKPYAIKVIDGAKVGIIGLTTTDTPDISSPGPNVKFLEYLATVQRYVKELTDQGVNKIIVLSHQGYDNDMALAAKLTGVDIIVGGHSHTLVGDYAEVGLKGSGTYPTLVKDAAGQNVLVVSSWQWGQALGSLQVDFDANGTIVKYAGTARMVAGDQKFRIYDLPGSDGKMKRVEYSKAADGTVTIREYDGKGYVITPNEAATASHLAAFNKLIAKLRADPRFLFATATPEAMAKLAMYSDSVNALKKQIATTAADDLKRANNAGPGPLVADSMLWKTGAQVAVMNPGGVRVDLAQGEVSVAQVYELQPFGNTLVILQMTGAELVKAIEDMTDFCITTYGVKAETAYVYLAGAKIALLVNGKAGARVTDVMIRKADGSYEPVDPAKTYKVVTNNFVSTGGDKNYTFGAIPADRKIDTGFIDSEAMLDFVRGKTIKAPTEERVRNVL